MQKNKQVKNGDFFDRHPKFPLCISIISLLISIVSLVIKIFIRK